MVYKSQGVFYKAHGSYGLGPYNQTLYGTYARGLAKTVSGQSGRTLDMETLECITSCGSDGPPKNVGTSESVRGIFSIHCDAFRAMHLAKLFE